MLIQMRIKVDRREKHEAEEIVKWQKPIYDEDLMMETTTATFERFIEHYTEKTKTLRRTAGRTKNDPCTQTQTQTSGHG